MPSAKLTKISIKELIEAYRAGESTTSLTLRFDITLNAIRYHARKAGVWEGRRIVPLPDRFWDKVNKTEACWIWQGAKIPNGYGTINIKGESILVHRYSYELAYGPIPSGLVVDHLCRNRLCVKPDHFEAVTNVINVKRGKDFFGMKYELKN